MLQILINITSIGSHFAITTLAIYLLLTTLKLTTSDKPSMHFILPLIANSFIIEGSDFNSPIYIYMYFINKI